METKDKCKKSIQEDDVSILKSDFTLPLPKLDQVASTKPPLKGFTRAMSNLVEEDSLPIKRTEEGFDPKAYKLLAKSGYDFKNPLQFGATLLKLRGREVSWALLDPKQTKATRLRDRDS